MIYHCRDNPRIRVKEKVAIVLLSYNSRSYLEQFLPFVLQTRYPDFRLIVVDNASTDDTADFLTAQYPQIDVVRIDVNRGFTNGFVKSLPFIEAEYYALLTSDVELPPDWLDPLLKAMEADPRLGACQPKIKAYRERDAFEYAGAAGGYLDIFGYPFCRGRIFDHVEKDRGQYDRPVEIFWASGAVFLIRAELYHRIGGFDNDFFAHMEEIDFCWRAALMGSQIWAVPESYVYHLGGGTLPNNSPRKLYLNYRNNLLMLRKNLPQPRGGIKLFGRTFKLFSIRGSRLFIRKFLDGLSAVAYIFQGKFSYCRAVWNAHKEYGKIKNTIKPSPRLDGLRGPTGKSFRSIYCVNGVYPHSIIRKFFSGRKKFSDLRF